MSLHANIILWTISLSLAIFGIIFGIIASYNSRKAYQNIKATVSSSWIADETHKHFYENITKLVLANKKVLIEIKKEKLITYDKYGLYGSSTRLAVIPKVVSSQLRETEFKDLTEFYIKNKLVLDKKFKLIFGDFLILSKRIEIPEDEKKKIIEYHQLVLEIGSEMLKRFAFISSSTAEYEKKLKKIK